jgi:hypothetical protein
MDSIPREPNQSSTREHCGHSTPRKKLTMQFSAILPHQPERNTTESDIASASNTAAKDEFIREKKRMAVEAFDVTMVASMSDAVHTSLKKWRVTLQELFSLATDTKFGVNHPINIATQATVKLYKANFHTLHAQVNRIQLNRFDNVAETLKTSSSSIVSSAGVAENESLAMPPVVLLDVETIEEDFCEDA